MGLLDMALGNNTAISVPQANQQYGMLLASGEIIEQAFKGVRDCYLMTTSRLIIVDKKGLTGRQTEFKSIPYRTVRVFSVQTAGTLDDDCELILWVAGLGVPLTLQFSRGQNVFALQAQLAAHVMR